MDHQLNKASCLVLVRAHLLIVDNVHAAEQHNLHKTSLNTCDNNLNTRRSKENHFSGVYLRSHAFGHDPSFMTIGEGRNEGSPVDQELFLLAQFTFRHKNPNWSIPIN